MDEILKKDALDLQGLLYQIGPLDYSGYFNLTRPALEAVKHLFVVIDNLQDKVSDLENFVLQLEYEMDSQI